MSVKPPRHVHNVDPCIPEMPGDGLCQKCRLRPATMTWAADLLALTHGGSQRWCERCVVVTQLESCKAAAAQIPALEARLREIDGGKTELVEGLWGFVNRKTDGY